MSAFMMVEIKIKDQDVYDDYMRRVPAVIERYKGEYVVRSSRVTPVAGGWAPDRIVVIRFDSLAELAACFGSPEYRALAVLRERSTSTRSIVVEE